MSESPLTELEIIINRLEYNLDKTSHEAYLASVKDAREEAIKAARENEAEKKRAAGKSSFFTSFSLRSNKKRNNNSFDPIAAALGSVPRSDRARRTLPTQGKSQFIDTLPVDEMVEDLRRLAELVVIGENYVTAQEKKRDRKLARSRKRWSSDRDSLEGVGSTADSDDDDDREEHASSPECAELFDLFFERNVLETIVCLLNGSAFDLVNHLDHLKHLRILKGGEEDDPENTDPETALMELPEEEKNRIFLPPINVAIQAIQSISILIQNVSRATSLYIILSNDHINGLIDLSLDRYAEAESKRRQDDGDESRAIFASPEMSELTTHFVTILKSLAMRMNAQTLQFFLKYPMELETGAPISSSHYSPMDTKSRSSSDKADGEGTQEALQVSFPLYQRALEFCAAHQETFVRVTAMNICLNTLRLTTIEPMKVAAPSETEVTDVEEEGAFGSSAALAAQAVAASLRPEKSISSPDGVLHTAEALPFRERLAIARHACIPSRVERLIAPIFTKLSERWTALDEVIREIDDNKGGVTETGGTFDKVEKAKEKVRRKRMLNNFLDKATDLQDELMLLEDVFKVGLTVLNEQLIEMMLATFVYPMISQPILNFYQRYISTMDSSRMSMTLEHPFGGYGGDYSDVYSVLTPFSGPAKTALFTIASVYHSISNAPLLRLLYAALFHPLSPDSTSVPTVRSNLLVSTVDAQGNATIRLDALRNNEGPIPNERSTYAFGTTPNNRRLSRTQGPDLAKLKDKEVCVFVLAPALAEVLEFDGNDVGLVARTKSNSYRDAIFQCFDLPSEFAELQALAICAVDAAVSSFDSKFASDIMLGIDLKTFADDIPADERNLDSEYAHMVDDRGLGGSATYESRHSVVRRRGGKVGSDLLGEFTSAMCKAAIFACRDKHGGWKLDYDEVAGHAVLCIGKGNNRAIVQTSKVLEYRWRQAATFLAERPGSIGSMYNPMGGSSYFFPVGGPNANADDYEEQLLGSILNTVLFDRTGNNDTKPVIEQFRQLKARSEQEITKEGFSLPVSMVSNFDRMCKRVGTFLMAAIDSTEEGEAADLDESRGSAFAFMKLDAVLSLLKDLAVSEGLALRDVDLQGIAMSASGSFVQTISPAMKAHVYAPISRSLTAAMVGSDESGSLPAAGSVLPLAGKKAVPCVCEAPAAVAHLFLDANTGVRAEGITWQSLYLVFSGNTLIFAQPAQQPGDGRVVSSCHMECMQVERDETGANEAPARRLFLSHTTFWPIKPPGLFFFDEKPTPAEVGPFQDVQRYISRLDVWFEHQRAADMAFKILSNEVFQAKANRGRRVQAFLDPKGNYLD